MNSDEQRTTSGRSTGGLAGEDETQGHGWRCPVMDDGDDAEGHAERIPVSDDPAATPVSGRRRSPEDDMTTAGLSGAPGRADRSDALRRPRHGRPRGALLRSVLGRLSARTLRRAAATTTALLLAGGAVLVGAPAANAAVLLQTGGTELGPVYGYGSLTCNPLRASSIARHYVQVTAPTVSATRTWSATGTVMVGGYGDGQTMLYRPQLEKYSAGGWRAVWVSPTWFKRDPVDQEFHVGWVDVNALYDGSGQFVGGAGYYRLSGTVWWLANESHHGGWLNYRLTAGEYNAGEWGGGYEFHSTKLSTPYCWAG